MSDVEKIYQEFWATIVEPDGVFDLEQVKKELFDYYQLLEQVPKVYCHITGYQVGNPFTLASVVCNLADDYYAREDVI